MPTARAALLRDLAAASAGLLFVSENDAPFSLVDAADLPFAKLDDDAARGLAGRPATDAVEAVTLEHFFRNAVRDQDWHGPAEAATAERYRALVAFIEAEIPDAKAYRVGAIAVSVLIVGTGPGGGALGLATTVVET